MKRFTPLTKSQLGIYIECMNHLDEPYYNLPYLYILDKSLDGMRLCQAVETAVKAHPTLFTRIIQDEDGEPKQTIDMENEEWTLSIEKVEDINQVKNHGQVSSICRCLVTRNSKFLCNEESIFSY